MPNIRAETAGVSPSDLMRRWLASAGERPRVLHVARRPHAGVLAQVREAVPCTLVAPAGVAPEPMPGVEFVGATAEGGRSRLWPVVRGLLREGRFGLLHSHGATAAVHAALANRGPRLPHLVTLHEPLRAGLFDGWLGRLKRWALTRALQQADAVLFRDDAVRADLLDNIPALRGSSRLACPATEKAA